MASERWAPRRRSPANLWTDEGPEGRQALTSALFTDLEAEGYQTMRYQLTPETADLGLSTALPAQRTTGGQMGGSDRGERTRACAFQLSVRIVGGSLAAPPIEASA